MSFSGGKDSTVLLYIARQLYPDIPAVFSNTGLEYAEIQRFVKTWNNVDIIVPKMRFDEVISTYGYPIIGKEVAEAIYYARRIRKKERKRIEVAENNLIEASSARNRRSVDKKRQSGQIGEEIAYKALPKNNLEKSLSSTKKNGCLSAGMSPFLYHTIAVTR